MRRALVVGMLPLLLATAVLAVDDVVIVDANGLAEGWTIGQGFTLGDYNGQQALVLQSANMWLWGEINKAEGVDISQTPIMQYTSVYVADGRNEHHRIGIPGDSWGAASVGFSDVLLDGAVINRWTTYISAGEHLNEKDLRDANTTAWYAANGTNLGGLLMQMTDANTIYITDWRFVSDAPVLFPGDADESGTVDLADLAILATNWNMVGGATWGMGDFNDDGNVDLADLAILATNWNQSAPVGEAAAALGLPVVPEPATLSLLGLGFAALIRRRR